MKLLPIEALTGEESQNQQDQEHSCTQYHIILSSHKSLGQPQEDICTSLQRVYNIQTLLHQKKKKKSLYNIKKKKNHPWPITIYNIRH